MNGKEIVVNSVINNKLDVGPLKDGTYILKVTKPNGETINRRFIKLK